MALNFFNVDARQDEIDAFRVQGFQARGPVGFVTASKVSSYFGRNESGC